MGKRLVHSFSPVIHDLILKKIGKNGGYNLFEIDEKSLGKSVEALKILGCSGANVTIPYKVEIMKYLDKISEEAESIGAVNTIEFISDKLIGHNTDYYGFGLTLKRHGIEVSGKNIVLLGTGGASKAVSRYVLDRGARSITYVSRDPNRFCRGKFQVISYDELYKIERSDIVINCTPCGMYPDADSCPVDEKILSRFNTAVDLIYNPQQTLFLKLGNKLGLNTANGLYMLVAQAAASQQIWQKRKIPLKAIDEIYNELLSREDIV
jgi:shikimate dehydrogenase